MKVCEVCFEELFDVRDGNNRCQKCKKAASKKKTAERRKEMDDLMASCGMSRVRGALGGTYYE